MTKVNKNLIEFTYKNKSPLLTFADFINRQGVYKLFHGRKIEISKDKQDYKKEYYEPSIKAGFLFVATLLLLPLTMSIKACSKENKRQYTNLNTVKEAKKKKNDLEKQAAEAKVRLEEEQRRNEEKAKKDLEKAHERHINSPTFTRSLSKESFLNPSLGKPARSSSTGSSDDTEHDVTENDSLSRDLPIEEKQIDSKESVVEQTSEVKTEPLTTEPIEVVIVPNILESSQQAEEVLEPIPQTDKPIEVVIVANNLESQQISVEETPLSELIADESPKLDSHLPGSVGGQESDSEDVEAQGPTTPPLTPTQIKFEQAKKRAAEMHETAKKKFNVVAANINNWWNSKSSSKPNSSEDAIDV